MAGVNSVSPALMWIKFLIAFFTVVLSANAAEYLVLSIVIVQSERLRATIFAVSVFFVAISTYVVPLANL